MFYATANGPSISKRPRLRPEIQANLFLFCINPFYSRKSSSLHCEKITYSKKKIGSEPGNRLPVRTVVCPDVLYCKHQYQAKDFDEHEEEKRHVESAGKIL
jgi:hypothetical protein